MNKTYWTTRDGRHIDVDDMDCQHLRNTLKIILSKQQRKEKKSKFTLHGDMANEFNNSFPSEKDEFDDLEEMWNNGEFYK